MVLRHLGVPSWNWQMLLVTASGSSLSNGKVMKPSKESLAQELKDIP